MALAIEMNNRMKRKAAAMGVLLNVETQKKFLKMASNAELQKSNVKLQNKIEQQREEYERVNKDFDDMHSWCFELLDECQSLKEENQKLKSCLWP